MLPAWPRQVNRPSYRSKWRIGAVVAAQLVVKLPYYGTTPVCWRSAV